MAGLLVQNHVFALHLKTLLVFVVVHLSPASRVVQKAALLDDELLG